MPVLVLDNGADTIKAGFSTDKTCQLFPNCVTKSKNERRRPFISSQVEELKDFSGLYYMRPYKRGYLVDWELEGKIWELVFGQLGVSADDTTVIITDPLLNLPVSFSSVNEMMFEEYEFAALCRCNPTWLSNYSYRNANTNEMCCLVVDSGFSSTSVVPYLKDSQPAVDAMKRLNIGGKLLTNYLKDTLSYRQMNVMNETYVINQVKEDVCFVTLDIHADLREAHKKPPDSRIACDYVLPDFAGIPRGYIKGGDKSGNVSDEQVLRLSNERFRVPEILFHPSDAHIRKMGVCEVIFEMIRSFPLDVQPHLWRNILLTGGNTHFKNFRERVELECRSAAPEIMRVNVETGENPLTHAWEGGALLGRNQDHLAQLTVTRAEYAEHGNRVCLERFNTVQHPT